MLQGQKVWLACTQAVASCYSLCAVSKTGTDSVWVPHNEYSCNNTCAPAVLGLDIDSEPSVPSKWLTKANLASKGITRNAGLTASAGMVLLMMLSPSVPLKQAGCMCHVSCDVLMLGSITAWKLCNKNSMAIKKQWWAELIQLMAPGLCDICCGIISGKQMEKLNVICKM